MLENGFSFSEYVLHVCTWLKDSELQSGLEQCFLDSHLASFNMKKVESAVRNIINGRPISNRDALGNRESLDYFERIRSELQK
jgi:hypothetical protein